MVSHAALGYAARGQLTQPTAVLRLFAMIEGHVKSLFCFGLGFSASVLAARLAAQGWTVGASSTSPAGAARIKALGYNPYLFDGTSPGPGIAQALATATHVVVSAPPGPAGDPVLIHHADDVARSPALVQIAYLSTIGVYGDWEGAWVDETSQLRPKSERSQRRAAAETGWLALGRSSGKTALVFRLAGIYGPGRSAIDNILDGSARRLIKPGQVFNRIHTADIAGILEAAIHRAPRHTIYNVADDEPAPPQDVVAFAAGLLGRPALPDVAYDPALLSPMGQSFYAENKRASNARAKGDLGWRLQYPSYREGLAAIAAEMGITTPML
jgi:nucleoside-diphosphate-sugar epimerase